MVSEIITIHKGQTINTFPSINIHKNFTASETSYDFQSTFNSYIYIWLMEISVLPGFAVIMVLLSHVAIIHFLKSSKVTLTSAIKRTTEQRILTNGRIYKGISCNWWLNVTLTYIFRHPRLRHFYRVFIPPDKIVIQLFLPELHMSIYNHWVLRLCIARKTRYVNEVSR